MYFCPFCSSLLVPEHTQSITLACPACPYFYKLNSTLTNTQFNSTKIFEDVFEEDLTNASKCQMKCPKCGFEEALFMELQTRSADEPMTIFYRCISCKNNWKE